jgi:hypothetical protein
LRGGSTASFRNPSSSRLALPKRQSGTGWLAAVFIAYFEAFMPLDGRM